VTRITPEFAAAIERLTPTARLDVIRAMVSPEAGRLERIWLLYEREDTHEVADGLIDIDQDAWARADAVAALVTSPSPAGAS
jgi:hypothetical protein